MPLSKVSVNTLLCQIPVNNVPDVFSGTYDTYRSSFLSDGNWLSNGTKKRKGSKILNPRINVVLSSDMVTPITHQKYGISWLFKEHLMCKKCDAKLLLIYKSDAALKVTCFIYATSLIAHCHVVTEVNTDIDNSAIPVPRKPKLPIPQVKKLLVDAITLNPSVKPNDLRIACLNAFPLEKFPVELHPSKKQVQDFKNNILRKQIPKNLGDKDLIEKYVANSNYLVHIEPEDSENWFLILKSGPKTFEGFLDSVNSINGVVGLDAQFKNNVNRLPLWILCAQNSAMNTVPGYVIMGERNSAVLLSCAIRSIQAHLLNEYDSG